MCSIHLANFLRIYYEPGTVHSTGDAAVNKTDTAWLLQLCSSGP